MLRRSLETELNELFFFESKYMIFNPSLQPIDVFDGNNRRPIR